MCCIFCGTLLPEEARFCANCGRQQPQLPQQRVLEPQLQESLPSLIAWLWHTRIPETWTLALETYWQFVKPENLELEREMDCLDPATVQKLDAHGWYDFLLNKYFRWKYTAPNRLATTTKAFKKYEGNDAAMAELWAIKERLFEFNKENIAEGLEIADSIKGLGPAGASGLLAIIFPRHFGTVDQFMVKALQEVVTLEEVSLIRGMIPEDLKPRDGSVLIDILRSKARDNNRIFGTDFWTPRRIDMVLWTVGHGEDNPRIKPLLRRMNFPPQ